MLFCVRGLRPEKEWRTGSVALGFWAMNVGLLLMATVSLLPVGLMQTWAAVTEGTWYARSAEFLQTPLMQELRWLRVIGDTIFAVGALSMGWFMLGQLTGWSIADGPALRPPVGPVRAEGREAVAAS
jgi:nitric oxide reductase subunit B